MKIENSYVSRGNMQLYRTTKLEDITTKNSVEWRLALIWLLYGSRRETIQCDTMMFQDFQHDHLSRVSAQ